MHGKEQALTIAAVADEVEVHVEAAIDQPLDGEQRVFETFEPQQAADGHQAPGWTGLHSSRVRGKKIDVHSRTDDPRFISIESEIAGRVENRLRNAVHLRRQAEALAKQRRRLAPLWLMGRDLHLRAATADDRRQTELHQRQA